MFPTLEGWRSPRLLFKLIERLHLLVILSGIILDFELAPANCTDLEAGFELLSGNTDT